MATNLTTQPACHRCGHGPSTHTAGVTGACTHGVCECRWLQVAAATGRC
jgi:hypothetical protein